MNDETIIDLSQAKRLVTQLRGRVQQLLDERDTLAHGYRIASDNCVRLEQSLQQNKDALRELVALHTESAGMTPDIVRDPERFDAFMDANELRVKAAVARARALLGES